MVRWQDKLLLPFKVGGQGCCIWAVCLNDSDNPTVWYDDDSPNWEQVGMFFSDYLHTSIWEWQVYNAEYDIESPLGKPFGYCAGATKIDFTEKDYEVVTQLLEEMPFGTFLTGTEKEYRFGKGKHRIRICTEKDAVENKVYWLFWVEEKDELEGFVQSISKRIRFDQVVYELWT
jgi:hypothetical protein